MSALLPPDDLTGIYKGEESLEWMKERDQQAGEVIEVTYAEKFKQMAVW